MSFSPCTLPCPDALRTAMKPAPWPAMATGGERLRSPWPTPTAIRRTKTASNRSTRLHRIPSVPKNRTGGRASEGLSGHVGVQPSDVASCSSEDTEPHCRESILHDSDLRALIWIKARDPRSGLISPSSGAECNPRRLPADPQGWDRPRRPKSGCLIQFKV